jgi:hypothetical protein
MSNLKFEDIRNALDIIQEVREVASNDMEYGFKDDFDTFISKMLCLNPQSYGSRIQKYLISRFGLTGVSASKDLGDFTDQFGEYWELKVSLVTPTNLCLNLVQIRPWQEIQGYYCIAIDTRISPFTEHTFCLTKSQMEEECILMNATAAHGTKTVTAKNNKTELRLSIKIDDNDKSFLRWCKKYGKKKMRLNKKSQEVTND